VTSLSRPSDSTRSPTGSRRGLVLKLALVVAVIGCGGVLLWRFWLSPGAPQAVEVSRADLTARGGRLYQAGQGQPFSGWLVERYPSGSIKSRSALVNGLLDGVSEGWRTNGQLQVREHFHRGLSHGLRTKWYANGNKLSEVTIVDGKLHGTFRRWHENGNLAEEIELRQGSPEGLSRAYYPSGCLKAEVRMENGKPVERKSWKDGELMASAGPQRGN